MRLKFLCLNLWYGGKLWDPMLNFLQAEKPDILAAQEAYGGTDPALAPNYRSVELIGRELGYPHTFFSPAFCDVRDVGNVDNGNAIFSRFPIRETRTVFFDVPYNPRRIEAPETFEVTPRNLQHAVIDLGGKSLQVFNTQGIWGKDGEDNERRLRMGEAIAREIRGKERVILAGDFNVKEGTKTIQNIERHLRSVFKGELVTSFNLRHKRDPGFATAVVDMVFASKDLRVLSHAAPDVNVSDHVPLVCVFEA